MIKDQEMRILFAANVLYFSIILFIFFFSDCFFVILVIHVLSKSIYNLHLILA
jgi:hypothetical protein